jgi:Protein of unknown function (DUF1153)
MDSHGRPTTYMSEIDMQIVDLEASENGQPSRLGGDTDRPRVADDFAAIHAHMVELRRERQRADLADTLPPCDTKRWVANRKAAVVIAVREGAISRRKACDWYQLSTEELASWEVAFRQYGTIGLRVSYRDVPRISTPHTPSRPVEQFTAHARDRRRGTIAALIFRWHRSNSAA